MPKTHRSAHTYKDKALDTNPREATYPTVLVRFTAHQHESLRIVLKESAKQWTMMALELDTATAPSTNAGDVCRKFASEAREIRSTLVVPRDRT